MNSYKEGIIIVPTPHRKRFQHKKLSSYPKASLFPGDKPIFKREVGAEAGEVVQWVRALGTQALRPEFVS